MIDLLAEQTRIKNLIENKGLSVVEIEKRNTNQSGIYIKSTGWKDKCIYSLFYWQVEIIEPSLAKHNSILGDVSIILTALKEDFSQLSHNRVKEIGKAQSQNISNGFSYTIEFTSTKRIYE